MAITGQGHINRFARESRLTLWPDLYRHVQVGDILYENEGKVGEIKIVITSATSFGTTYDPYNDWVIYTASVFSSGLPFNDTYHGHDFQNQGGGSGSLPRYSLSEGYYTSPYDACAPPPTLISPANGVDSNGHCEWSPGSLGTNNGYATTSFYRLRYKKLPWGGYVYIETSNTECSIPDLESGAVYEWVVFAYSAYSMGQNSETRTFNYVPSPEKPINPTPANTATEVDWSAKTISWVNGGGATSYNVYFGQSGTLISLGNQSGISKIVPYTTQTINDVVHAYIGETEEINWDIPFYWRIDAVNNAGTTTGDDWWFDARPAKATTPTPENAAIDVTLFPTFEWV
jgi:hypothetical protein